MDDFDRAAEIAYTHSPSISEEVKKQASLYCTNLRESPTGWKICLDKLQCWTRLPADLAANNIHPMSDYSKFFCLEVLNYTIVNHYFKLSNDDRNALRSSILVFIRQLATSGHQPHFLIGKLTTLLIAMVRHDFPHDWPGFFDDFLSVLSQQASALSITIFLRMLTALEEDVIQSDVGFAITDKKSAITRSNANSEAHEAAVLSMRIKDALRVTSLPKIIAAIHSIIYAYSENVKSKENGTDTTGNGSSKAITTGPGAFATAELASLALSTLAKYVQWIDIGLVVNPQFFPLVYSFMDNPETQISACVLLTRICAKGMPGIKRIQMFSDIHIVDFLSRYLFSTAGNDSYGGSDNSIPEANPFAVAMARLLCTVGSQAIETFTELASPFVSASQLYIQHATKSHKAKTSIMKKSIFNNARNTQSSTTNNSSNVNENQYLYNAGFAGYLAALHETGSASELGLEGITDLTPETVHTLVSLYGTNISSATAQAQSQGLGQETVSRKERAKALVVLVNYTIRLLSLGVACLENVVFEIGREAMPFLILSCTLLRLPSIFPTTFKPIRDALVSAVCNSFKYPSWYEYNADRALRMLRSTTNSKTTSSTSDESSDIDTHSHGVVQNSSEYEDLEEEYDQYRSNNLERLLKLLAQVDRKYVCDYLLNIFIHANTLLLTQIHNSGDSAPLSISVVETQSGIKLPYDISLQKECPVLHAPNPSGVFPFTPIVPLDPVNSANGYEGAIQGYNHKQHTFLTISTSLKETSIYNISQLSYAEIEFPLHMMYLLGEILGPNIISFPHKSLWIAVFLSVYGSPLTFHAHPLVRDTVFDIYSRFDKIIPAAPSILIPVIKELCSNRGLYSPIYGVRSKACMCLEKLLRGIEEQHRPILRVPEILQILIPATTNLLTSRFSRGLERTRSSISMEDANKLVEALSIVVGKPAFYVAGENVGTTDPLVGNTPPGSVDVELFVREYCSIAQIIYDPFRVAIDNIDLWISRDSTLTVDRLGEYIALITSYFRVLTQSDVANDKIGGLIRECSSFVLHVLRKIPNNELLCHRSIALLHCFIEILRGHSIPIFLEYIPVLLESCTNTSIVIIIQLINNIICRFKDVSTSVVSKLFYPIVERVSSAINSFGDIIKITSSNNSNVSVTVPAATSQQQENDINLSAALSHQRTQCLDIRRVFYTFLRDIFSQGLYSVIIEPANEQAMLQALHLTKEGLTYLFDTGIVKSSIHILSKFIHLWHMEANDSLVLTSGAIIAATNTAITNGVVAPSTSAQSAIYQQAAAVDGKMIAGPKVITKPTLRTFILHEIIPLVISTPFFPELNYYDATFMSLMREISTMFKMCYFAIGDEFLVVFYEQLQIYLQMPPAPVQALVTLYQENKPADVCVASLRDIIVEKRKDIDMMRKQQQQ